jgi:valyl-tRNA synthetase
MASRASTRRRYDPQAAEARWQRFWEERGIYRYSRQDTRPVYAVDTPPPTVSGDLHLGHCYSYSQTDFLVRFWRMNGRNVYYPMGWDNNGLPTERLVERSLGIKPADVGREAFAEAIRRVSREHEARYEEVWRRLALSVDWRYTYSTVSAQSQRVAQRSFLDLYEKGLAYRAAAPSIWCPLCRTAIAQAEVDDLERETTYVTLAFELDDGRALPIATTRPELLPACVAIFVHPEDGRYHELVGRTARVPLFGGQVTIRADERVDPEKGTGVVMCCTFGDTTDVEWWYRYGLPLISVIERDGTLNALAGPYGGLDVPTARARIAADLTRRGLVLAQVGAPQTVRVHDRCDTPVEFIETQQWFIRLLEHKDEFLQAGREIAWHPPYMRARYESWVQNLAWDWCISRQRYYGVPFPVWYCDACGEVVLAEPAQLPVNPLIAKPAHPCACGGTTFTPDSDVMDTWATSSLSPQIAGRWLEDGELFTRVFPMSLRPHAHEIIRTWTFYTIVKSLYHLGQVPWSNVVISGFGLLPKGEKMSKSRDGSPLAPLAMMQRYSADSLRYWAAGTGLGRDAMVDETKFAVGQRLVTKLWNIARFGQRFLQGYQPASSPPELLPADAWILSRLQRIIARATDAFQDCDYVTAKDEVESFLWGVLADNYVEMVKARLYELPDGDPRKEAARYTLHTALLAIVRMLAPILPHIAEEIYHLLSPGPGAAPSVHVSSWPQVEPGLVSDAAEVLGEALVAIASEARRFKTAGRLPLGSPLARIGISSPDQALLAALRLSELDIRSVTRARELSFSAALPQAAPLPGVENVWLSVEPGDAGALSC